MERQTGVGLLLNTSFNVNGKPILTTVKDVFNILKNTQLDGVVVEDNFITKHRVTDEYYCLGLVKKFNS
jgi:carbamoyltransferase